MLTVGTPDNNGLQPNASSYVKLVTQLGVAGPPNDADMLVLAHINDVRCGPQGGTACPGGVTQDFAGRLVLRTSVRVTDKANTGDAGTVQSFPLDFPVQCTPSATAGGTCDATTSLNSLLPGAIVEGQRSIIELGQMRVYDPGPNGTGFGTGLPAVVRGRGRDGVSPPGTLRAMTLRIPPDDRGLDLGSTTMKGSPHDKRVFL